MSFVSYLLTPYKTIMFIWRWLCQINDTLNSLQNIHQIGLNSAKNVVTEMTLEFVAQS